MQIGFAKSERGDDEDVEEAGEEKVGEDSDEVDEGEDDRLEDGENIAISAVVEIFGREDPRTSCDVNTAYEYVAVIRYEFSHQAKIQEMLYNKDREK